MQLAQWLLFLHISGVVLYVGGDVVLNIQALLAFRNRHPGALLEAVKGAGPVVSVGAVLTLLSGLAMVFLSPAWRFSMTWIWAGLLAMLIAGAAEGLYFKKKLQAVQDVLDEKGPHAPEMETLLKQVAIAATLVNVIFFVVIWLMTFKPL